MRKVEPEDAPEFEAIRSFLVETIDNSEDKAAAAIAAFDVSVRALGIVYGDHAPGIVRATADKLSLLLLSGAGE